MCASSLSNNSIPSIINLTPSRVILLHKFILSAKLFFFAMYILYLQSTYMYYEYIDPNFIAILLR